ncbi:hypothetical protein O6H91_03G002800 [Diphasiastrum complanatum]|uniref:Uncharacterized protein n=1 Tax=Diphasiastrum complanatum TaxID=34168 RepID=A0ACC2E392_DIPCM|nr:hypothetical protein O6H91_03G002800 [Diphasiastrum complanatum]
MTLFFASTTMFVCLYISHVFKQTCFVTCDICVNVSCNCTTEDYLLSTKVHGHAHYLYVGIQLQMQNLLLNQEWNDLAESISGGSSFGDCNILHKL